MSIHPTGGSTYVQGPPSIVSMPAPADYVPVYRPDWETIRNAVQRQTIRDFPWFNNAGVFLLGWIPGSVIFLVGWGPIYDALSSDLQRQYALVPGFVIVGTILLAGLGLFFMFLDHQMRLRTSADASSLVQLMDRAVPKPANSADADATLPSTGQTSLVIR